MTCRGKCGSKGIWHRFKGRNKFGNLSRDYDISQIFPTPMPLYGGLKSKANMELP